MADYGDDGGQRRSGGDLTEKVKQTLGKVMEGVGVGSGGRTASSDTTGYGMGVPGSGGGLGGGLGGDQQDPAMGGYGGTGTEGYGTGAGGGARVGSDPGMGMGSDPGMGMGLDPYGSTGGTRTGTGMGTDPSYGTTAGTRTGMGMGTDPYAAADQPGMGQQQGTGRYDDQGSLLEKAKDTLSKVTGGRRE